MKTIYKYRVPIDGQPHRMPGTVVHAGFDGKTWDEPLIVWSECWPVDQDEGGLYQVFGTGNPVPEDALHRCTVIAPPSVWHLYQLRDETA